MTTVLGTPGWIWAVGVSCASSFLTVSGFVLQKKGQGDGELDADGRRRYPKIGDIVLSPRWLLGFFFSVVAPLPGDLIAYGLAPLSLTTPLSGFTVVLNLVLAPKMLGEKIQRFPDLPATVVILMGTVLTTFTGAREDEHEVSLDQLLALALEPLFLALLAALLVLLVCSFAYMKSRRAGIEQRARERPTNPVIYELVLPAFFAAGCGGVTNIALKAVSEFLGQGMWLQGIAAALLGVAPFAVLQLNFVNRGLGLYMQTVYFPVYNSLLVPTTTFYGAVYYQEYQALVESPWRIVAFVGGVLLIVLGICGFTLRKAEAEPEPCSTEGKPVGAEKAQGDSTGTGVEEGKLQSEGCSDGSQDGALPVVLDGCENTARAAEEGRTQGESDGDAAKLGVATGEAGRSGAAGGAPSAEPRPLGAARCWAMSALQTCRISSCAQAPLGSLATFGGNGGAARRDKGHEAPAQG